MADDENESTAANAETGWIVDDEHSTLDNRYRLKLENVDDRTYIWTVASYREHETFVCHKLVWPEFTKPQAPIDPFNLVADGWKCVDRDLRRGETDVMRVYEETYERLGQWTDYNSGATTQEE